MINRAAASCFSGFGHVVPARVIVERQGQPPFIGGLEVGSAKGKGINSLFRHGFADRHQLVKGGGNFPAVFRHHVRVIEQEHGLGGSGNGIELAVIAAGVQGPIHYISGPIVGFRVSGQVGGQAVDGELHTVSRPIGAVDVRAAVGGQSGLQYAVIIALPYGENISQTNGDVNIFPSMSFIFVQIFRISRVMKEIEI